MRSKIRAISSCLFLILFMFSVSYAKEWRGIVPLHSSCEDVKRIMGHSTCNSSFYDLRDETVVIHFSTHPCDERLPGGWNVQPGTVTSIFVNTKSPKKLADLHIDESRYKKLASEHHKGIIQYTNDEEGFAFTLYPDGKVWSFFYTPSAQDEYLRCHPSTDSKSDIRETPNVLPRFDEYNDISFESEKKRLDDFATALREMYGQGTLGYIIIYGGLRSRVGEAQMRAERAKNYLVNICGIDPNRIVTVDGRYREEVTTELWFKPSGVTAPKARPTVPSKDVKLIN